MLGLIWEYLKYCLLGMQFWYNFYPITVGRLVGFILGRNILVAQSLTLTTFSGPWQALGDPGQPAMRQASTLADVIFLHTPMIVFKVGVLNAEAIIFKHDILTRNQAQCPEIALDSMTHVFRDGSQCRWTCCCLLVCVQSSVWLWVRNDQVLWMRGAGLEGSK